MTPDRIVVVPIAAEEWFWLRRLEELTGDKPSKMIASMLRHIRIDDERAHEESYGGRRN